MSNHSGSYMLNRVLLLLEERGVFRQMGQEAAQRLVLDIEEISRWDDCNAHEILAGIGARLGICSYCVKPRSDLTNGVCVACRQA